MFPQNSGHCNNRYTDGCERRQISASAETQHQEDNVLNSEPLRKRVISAAGYHLNQQLQQNQHHRKKLKKRSEGQDVVAANFGTSSTTTNTFQQQPSFTAAASSASEVVLSSSTSSSNATSRQVLHQPSLPPGSTSSTPSSLPSLTQPFLQMDPTFLALMMSNPAVAMAGLSAMAATAPPTAATTAAQHQQQQFIAAAAAAVAQIAAAAAAASTTSASTAAPSSSFPTIMDAINQSATGPPSSAPMQECLSHTYRPSPRNDSASKGGIRLNSGISGAASSTSNANRSLFHNPLVSDVSTNYTTSVSAAASSSSSSSTVLPGVSASSNSSAAVHHPMPLLTSHAQPYSTNTQIGAATITPNDLSLSSIPTSVAGKALPAIPSWGEKVSIASHKSKPHQAVLSSSSSAAAAEASRRGSSPNVATTESLNFATLLDLKKWKPAKLGTE